MPTPNSRVEPFVGYRVALATEADTSSLLRLAPPDPTVHALLAGQRSITLPPRVATPCMTRRKSLRALSENGSQSNSRRCAALVDEPCSSRVSH